MADATDAALEAAYNAQTKGSIDDQLEAAYREHTGGGPRHSMVSGVLGQALHAGTFHADDYLTSEAWQRSNKRFEAEHPWASAAGQAAGVVLPMFTPAGWVARGAAALPRIARAAEYVLPYGNFSRAVAPGAGARTVLHQSGLGSLKMGALNRFNDPAQYEQSGDTYTDAMRALTSKLTNAGNLPSAAIDYGTGAAGGYVGNRVGGFLGNRIGTLAQKANTGTDTRGNALRALAQDIGYDNPDGVQRAVESIRNIMYGEGSTLGRSGFGNVPLEAEREMARNFISLTEQHADAEAERRLGAHLAARAAPAAQARAAGQAHPDEWLLNPRTGQPYADATLGAWARRAGEAYRNRNAVPSNLTELSALAAGGEAPSLQTTLRKLLNLKGEGGNRSEMLRELRNRQRNIGPQLEATLARYTGGRSVPEMIQQHARNAENANALYPAIHQDLAALPDAETRIAAALRPVIEGYQQGIGNERDTISRTTLSEVEKFLNPVEVQGAGSMRPLTANVTENVKDAAGNIVGKTQTVVPMRRITPHGDVTESYVPGGTTTAWNPSGNLESILRRRAALGDAIQNSRTPQGENTTLTHHLTQLKDNISNALRNLGDANGDPFQRVMARWASANDQRATAGSLRNAYDRFVGLNLGARRGQSLQEMERGLAAFRNMDAEHQDMARQGIFAQFRSMLEGKGDYHDAAKIFSNPRVRRILEEIIGPEATEEFGGSVARSGLATNTFNMNKGSQTSSILDESKRSGWLESIWGALYHGNPLRAISHVGEQVGDYTKRIKYDQMTDLLRRGTHNPAELEAALEAIRRAGLPAHPLLQRPIEGMRPAGNVAGVALSKRRDESSAYP